MSFVDRIATLGRFARDLGSSAAEVAMQQPGVRRRVEDVKAVVRTAREHVEARFDRVERDLWSWINEAQERAHKAHRQVDRARSADGYYKVLGVDKGADMVTVNELDGQVSVVLGNGDRTFRSEQTFDTDAFDPWTQRTIYTYGRRDAPADLALDSDLVERFVQRVRSHARASFATLQEQRNLREMLQGGLTGREDVQAYAERQALAAPTPDDAASWRAFLRDLQG